jgi:hypothetical protein
MIFSRENLIDMLRTNVVTVTFTKVNGEERVMQCTLLPEYVPNAPTNNGQVLLQESEAKAVSVWDVQANGWRSFRVDSVKSISMG